MSRLVAEPARRGTLGVGDTRFDQGATAEPAEHMQICIDAMRGNRARLGV